MMARDISSARMKGFGIRHKVPVGDTPYIRAKQVQLVEKNPEAAIALFWAAINAGDRVESALKDMAIVMKQLGRAEEAIEAVKSFRHRCSLQAQESLDNVLLDLYKKCGKVDEQIVVLKEKLRLIQHGLAFNGNPTKTARSHGKKFQLSIKQRLVAFWKAQYFIADANKACNLGVCLMKQGKVEEAIAVLEVAISMDEKDFKSLERAKQLLKEIQDLQVHGCSKRSLSTTSNHNHYELESTSASDGEKYYSNKKYGFLSSSTNCKEILSSNGVLNMVNWEAEIDTQRIVARKRHR